jgi:3-O-methylgallate 3,4-dioxygenase
MADVVLGIGTSHTPQITVPWHAWPNMSQNSEVSSYVPPDLDAQLQPEVHQQRYEAVQAAVKKLSQVLRATEGLDAIVIFGDDQHEQFYDDNMPAIAIYHGGDFGLKTQRNRRGGDMAWLELEEAGWEKTHPSYSTHSELAKHLIASLADQDFDVTRCSQLREGVGIGHAFSFLYRRLWADCPVPIVPIMMNTYYPPNQPTPKRAYGLGKAVRKALMQWDGGQRVAVIASGGLSHIVLDEEIDHQVLRGLREKDEQALFTLPRHKLRGGTSEILNWVALAGAVGPFEMTLVDYVPGYRSRPTTGCAMTFAYWQ